jgi:hypothetical protein
VLIAVVAAVAVALSLLLLLLLLVLLLLLLLVLIAVGAAVALSLLLLLLLLQVTQVEPSDPHHIAITNSFGMPSMDRDFLLKDIPAAKAALNPGQVRAHT